ncbi:hypothetical protein BS50DRAFT_677495 [Corynespora cassiicola Philippines]|uniref:BTB domain-containing protein n=1 Tax=Corynespora cassiicola Philippines TaxID=1448308 RepID=A0A2T2NLD2_CORCC|nr:hypothetical protein BS50DRAFT_677495 [Corynespora cassiicola Philippines]
MATKNETYEANLFNNKTFSDVIVRHETYGNNTPRIYQAHKAVLSLHSKFFMKAFMGNFKEASEREIKTFFGNPGSFEFALKFIYTQTYDCKQVKTLAGKDEVKRVLIPCEIYRIADYYGITNLKEHATNDLVQALKSSCFLDGKPNMSCIKEVLARTYAEEEYESGTYLGMKIVLEIMKRNTFTFDDDFRDFLANHQAFAADLALICYDADLLSVTSAACKSCLHTHFFKVMPVKCRNCRAKFRPEYYK